jgi:hypothetical protein
MFLIPLVMFNDQCCSIGKLLEFMMNISQLSFFPKSRHLNLGFYLLFDPKLRPYKLFLPYKKGLKIAAAPCIHPRLTMKKTFDFISQGTFIYRIANLKFN